jgi:hypothetical protein
MSQLHVLAVYSVPLISMPMGLRKMTAKSKVGEHKDAGRSHDDFTFIVFFKTRSIIVCAKIITD